MHHTDGVMDRVHYCDLCLQEFSCTRCWIRHLHSVLHLQRHVQYQTHLEYIFDRNLQILEKIGTWERCVSCGATCTHTTVLLMCCRCTGAGNAAPSSEGIPGVLLQHATVVSGPRYICRRCARSQWCRSCASFLGPEAYCIDVDALEEYKEHVEESKAKISCQLLG